VVTDRNNAGLRRELWRAFQATMAGGSAVRCGLATSDGYMNVHLGLECGSTIVMARVRKREIGVQFLLDDPTAATVFSLLSAHQAEIEAAFGAPLLWRAPSARAHEIEARRPADITDRESWPELCDWFAAALGGLRAALGPYAGVEPAAGERRRWDELSFFAELARLNPGTVAAARALLDWARAAMPAVYWGKGRRFGSFVPGLRRGGHTHTLVSVWTSGTFVPRFAALRKTPPFSDEALRAELLDRLNAVPHFALPHEVLDRFPTLPLALLEDPAARSLFIGALDWYVATVKRESARAVATGPRRRIPIAED
jgi:hypothetical protein